MNGLLMYKIDGSFYKRCNVPTGLLDGYGYIGPDKFVAYKQWFNLPKTGGNQLLIYNKEMNLTDSLIFSFPDTISIPSNISAFDNFSIYKGNMYLRQKLSDTIFQIDRTNSITPFLVVDLGDLKAPSLIVPITEMRNNFMQLYSFRRINNYYFIRLSGQSRIPGPGLNGFEKDLVYNRINGETYFLNIHKDPYHEEFNMQSMLINDMDGMNDPPILWYLRNEQYIDYLDIIVAKTYLESGTIRGEKEP